MTTSDLDTNEDSTSTTSISLRPAPHTSVTAVRLQLPPSTQEPFEDQLLGAAQPLIGPADHGVHELLRTARAGRLQDAEFGLQGVSQLVNGEHIGSSRGQFQSQGQSVQAMADPDDSLGGWLVESVVDQRSGEEQLGRTESCRAGQRASPEEVAAAERRERPARPARP